MHGQLGQIMNSKIRKGQSSAAASEFQGTKAGYSSWPLHTAPGGVGSALRPPLQPDPQLRLPPAQSSSHLRSQLPVNSGRKQGHLLHLFTPACFSTSPHKALPGCLLWPLSNFFWLKSPRVQGCSKLRSGYHGQRLGSCFLRWVCVG